MFLSKGKPVFQLLKPCPNLCVNKYSTASSSVDISHAPDSFPAKKEKPKKPPFMKNVFLGVFDRTFLEYPRSRNLEFSNNTQEFYNKAINHFNNSPEGLNSYEKFKFLIGNGLFSLNSPEIYDGSSTMHTEMLLLFEKLNLDASLATLLEAHYSIIIPTLIKHGSPELKRTYLDKLLRGEITGAYAMAEESSGSDPSALKLTCSENEGKFILNGDKIWVTNALNADFYITIGSMEYDNWKLRDTLFLKDMSAFLVPKSHKVNITKHDLCGLNDCGVGKLKFSNVEIPSGHLIGESNDGYAIAREIIPRHKFISLASVLCSMKGLVSTLTSTINSKKQAKHNPRDHELIRRKVLNIMRVIYCLESMLYANAHTLDTYDIDSTLESALLQIYGFETAIKTVLECLEIIGSKVYDNNFPYEKLLRDLKGLSLHTTNIDITKLFVSMTGLEHIGKNLKEIIMKNRNPFNYPLYIFKKIFFEQSPHKDPKLTLQLYMELHPSLKQAGDLLEESVIRLKVITELLLSRHAQEIVYRQLDLQRLTVIAMNIFVMTSVLSRASHSYCTGVENCDNEVIMANIVCYEASNQVRQLYKNLLSLEEESIDVLSLQLGATTFNKELYFFQHPLKHVI